MTFGVVAVPFLRSFSRTVRVTSAPLLLPMRMSLMGRSAHPGATGPRNLRHGQDPPPSGSRLGPSSASLRINPDRLVFDTPPRFNASPYLVDPLLKSAYLDPYALLRPASQWPKTKRARVMASRDQQFELFRKWENVESLFLLPAASSEVRYRCGRSLMINP